MNLKAYLKGKLRQIKKIQKEEYNEGSDRGRLKLSFTNLYSNEVYKAGDANGYYIFKLGIVLDHNENELYKLLENLRMNNIGFNLVELYADDKVYRLYMHGTARNFATLINKYTYGIYEPSNIFTKSEVNQLLLYPAIYRCINGNMLNFDTSIPEEQISHIAEKSFEVNLKSNTDSMDFTWKEKYLGILEYDYAHNEFTVKYNENNKLKEYMNADNILEEENNKFDPSIDEIV